MDFYFQRNFQKQINIYCNKVLFDSLLNMQSILFYLVLSNSITDYSYGSRRCHKELRSLGLCTRIVITGKIYSVQLPSTNIDSQYSYFWLLIFQFVMSPEDDAENSIEATSATACHCVVLKAINKARQAQFILTLCLCPCD